jgi:hypothetical protein
MATAEELRRQLEMAPPGVHQVQQDIEEYFGPRTAGDFFTIGTLSAFSGKRVFVVKGLQIFATGPGEDGQVSLDPRALSGYCELHFEPGGSGMPTMTAQNFNALSAGDVSEPRPEGRSPCHLADFSTTNGSQFFAGVIKDKCQVRIRVVFPPPFWVTKIGVIATGLSVPKSMYDGLTGGGGNA